MEFFLYFRFSTRYIQLHLRTYIVLLSSLIWFGCQNKNQADVEAFDDAYESARIHISDSIQLSFNACQTAIELADKMKDPESLGKAYWMMGYLYDLNQQTVNALHYYNGASAVYKSLEDYKSTSMLLENCGTAALGADAFEIARLKYHERLSIVKKHNLNELLADAHYDLGLAFLNLNIFDSANFYQLKALELVRDNNRLKSDILNELGLIQNSIENYDSAILLFDQAGSLDKSLAKQYKTEYNKGLAFRRSNRLDQSLKWYKKSLASANKLSDRARISALEGIGEVWYKMGNKDSAALYLKQSLEMNLPRTPKDNAESYQHSMRRSTLWKLSRAYQIIEEIDSVYASEVARQIIMGRFSTFVNQIDVLAKRETIRAIELANSEHINAELERKLKGYSKAKSDLTTSIAIILSFFGMVLLIYLYRRKGVIKEVSKILDESNERLTKYKTKAS